MPPRARPLLLFLACVLGVLLPATVRAAEPGSQPRFVELRLKHGDDPRWSARDWDDRDWERIWPTDLPARTGVFWVRIRVARGHIDPRQWSPSSYWLPKLHRSYTFTWPAEQPIDGIFIAAVFSFELFWDGRLLERSGVVGSSRETEKVGPLDHLIRIPDDLLGPGEHVIALRMSSYHYNFPANQFGTGFVFVNFASRLAFESRQPLVPLMLLTGAVLVTAMSLLMHVFVERRRSLVLCALLSFAIAMFYGLIALRWLYNASYDWHAPRIYAITVMIVIIGVLLPWLLVEQFGVLRRGRWLLALVPMLVAAWLSSSWQEIRVLWICRAGLVVSLGITLWAVWLRRPGARWVLPVLLVSLPVVQMRNHTFLDSFFFLSLEAVVFIVFATLGLQVQADRKRAREAQLMAARLETELLKKNIQPHFLLNTLATLIEVIEQEPKTAVALIEALAGEFRILAGMAGEKLIPLAQELELCQAHLRVMSLRKGTRCILDLRDVDERVRVPPALFHTLIENGLTHLGPRAGEQRFLLQMQRASDVTRYVLVAHGVRLHEQDTAARPRDGTGIRYIKARLEESFTGHWEFRSESCDEGWRTEIQIRQAAKAGASSETGSRDASRAHSATPRSAGREMSVGLAPESAERSAAAPALDRGRSAAVRLSGGNRNAP